MTIRSRLHWGRWARKDSRKAPTHQHHAKHINHKVHTVTLGAAKLITHLKGSVQQGEANVEKSSVYGAAIVIPQVARTSGWSHMLFVLTLRSFTFLAVNFFAQAGVLYMIWKEELVWDLFAGQMWVCDLAASIQTCPHGPNCIGPGGTVYTPPRLYSWSQWSSRVFARDSVKALFPELDHSVDANMDPGEYGVESYWCRWVCCFLFMVTVMGDLQSSFCMMRMIWLIPNEAEPWIDYHVPSWAEKTKAKEIHGWTEFDLVRIKVAGMPIIWKLINVFFVLIPKLVIWKITCEAGITFLMETTGIEDIIVNCTALMFILNIDEMMCQELMSAEVRQILEKVEDFEETTNEHQELEALEDHELLEKHNNADLPHICRFLCDLIPRKVVLVSILTASFVQLYYVRGCTRNEHNSWVPQSMYLPTSTFLSFFEAFFPNMFQVETEEEAYWEYPAD